MPFTSIGSSLCVRRIVIDGAAVALEAEGAEEHAPCPACGQASYRVHDRYQRRPLDLPWRGTTAHLIITVRSFCCDNPRCSRATFVETFDPELPACARRTAQVTAYLSVVGRLAGGEAGARLAHQAGVPVSPDTLLRLQRMVALPANTGETPRVLGVDDLALRRGQTYATLLLNLETHRPVDLLPGRDAGVLDQWLRDHPGVEILVRDRSGDDAKGAKQGAPDAIQVADRFHLVKNATDALKELLRGRPLQSANPSAESDSPTPEPAPSEAPITAAPAPTSLPASGLPLAPATPLPAGPTPPAHPTHPRAAARHAAKLARWEQVRAMLAAGRSISSIAKELGISRPLVRKLAAMPDPPCPSPQAAPTGRLFSSALHPFVSSLQERWAAGCTNVTQLFRELVARGYTGSRPSLARALQGWPRPQPAELPTSVPRASKAELPPFRRRDRRRLCLCPPAHLDQTEQTALQAILAGDAALGAGYDLVQRFHTVVMTGDVPGLENWLSDAQASVLPPFVSLANGIRADRCAVEAALTLPWSNGPVEGHVCRVKCLKRLG